MNIIKSISFIALLCKLIECSNPNSDWCPKVKCKDFRGCRPCHKMFIFIIAQGRSGSTTIKNMLNLLPGVRIGGEIGTTLDNMIDLWKYVKYGPEDNLKRGRGNFEGPWGHYFYPEEYLSCPAQELMSSINPPENLDEIENPHETILGFKEIRLYTKEHLEFLLKHFPCSRFIFSIRSDEKALKQSQRKNLEIAIPTSQNVGVLRLYRHMARGLLANRAYMMDLDVWSKGEGKELHFNALARWLGFEDCKYPSILHDNRADGLSSTLDTNRFKLGPECRRKGKVASSM